jgi:hypothetical protein
MAKKPAAKKFVAASSPRPVAQQPVASQPAAPEPIASEPAAPQPVAARKAVSPEQRVAQGQVRELTAEFVTLREELIALRSEVADMRQKLGAGADTAPPERQVLRARRNAVKDRPKEIVQRMATLRQQKQELRSKLKPAQT